MDEFRVGTFSSIIMYNDEKLLKYQLQNKKKAKYEMGNFCEQYEMGN